MAHPTIAEKQDKDWFPVADWVKRHESLGRHHGTEPVDIVFLGDSISEGWLGEGKGVWERTYAPRHAITLGIGGDETQHVLWRLDNDAVKGLKPRVLALLIGTNNIGNAGHEAGPVALGIKAVVKSVRSKLPDTRILLMGIFPRDAKPGTPWRKAIQQINADISKLDDGKHVHFVDIGDRFTNADGTISPEIMPDALHLSARGYQIWADAIEPTLKKMLSAQ